MTRDVSVPSAAPSEPDGLERLDYQDGQMLDAEEFRVEQEYFVELIRLHTQAFFLAGVANGLDVSGLVAKDGRYQLTLAPGVGVDGFGHHLVVTSTRTITLPKPDDIVQPSAFETGGANAGANPAAPAATPSTTASLAGNVDIFLRYQLTQQVLPEDGGIKRLRWLESPMVIVRAEVKVGDLLVPYYFDQKAQPLLEIPGQALGFRVVRVAGTPPALVPNSTQRSGLRAAAGTSGPSVPLPPPLVLQGSGALAAGRATVTVPNWSLLSHLASTLVPQVWPYLSSPLPDPIHVSPVVASQLSSQGTFDVLALDATNPTQAFSWELRLTT